MYVFYSFPSIDVRRVGQSSRALVAQSEHIGKCVFNDDLMKKETHFYN